MTGCTATLTTTTVTPCDCGCDKRHPENVTPHTLTCFHAHPHPAGEPFHDALDSEGSVATWSDDAPGATPHTPTSTVTDAEVEAAVDAMLPPGESWAVQGREDAVVMARRYLEAAAAARAAQRDDR